MTPQGCVFLLLMSACAVQEIAGTFEASLVSPAAPESASQPESEAAEGLALQPSRALVRGLQQCCSRQVCLPPLTDRFLRLLLQLLTRYASWLHDGLQTHLQQRVWPSSGAMHMGSRLWR